jgi:hypothetical protein
MKFAQEETKKNNFDKVREPEGNIDGESNNQSNSLDNAISIE